MAKTNKQAESELQEVVVEINNRIDKLGEHTNLLFQELNNLQNQFNLIKGVPNEDIKRLEALEKIRLKWISEANKISKDFEKTLLKNVGVGAAGIGIGVGLVTLGPNVAMGVATTFGVASTGTAISSLSGIVATNAALAWLGGGSIAAGGGGIIAGKALLALTGPLGWSLAVASFGASGIFFIKKTKDKQDLENISNQIYMREIKSHELAIIEINERTYRIKNERLMIIEARMLIEQFGVNYEMMTQKQQYQLGSYVNLMNSSTQLLVNPILGLQPKYNEYDYSYFSSKFDSKIHQLKDQDFKRVIIYLSNTLYKIDYDERDKKLLWKSLRKNKDFLKSMNISKKQFTLSVMNIVSLALNLKYKTNST